MYGDAIVIGCPLEVLVVEDDEGVASALHHALHYAGVACSIALDSADALETLAEAAPELAAVLVDQHLPTTTGTTLLGTVRTLYPRLVRVLTTGQVTDEVRAAQADDTVELLFEKPWSADDLSNLVSWLRERVRERDARADLARAIGGHQ